MTELHVYNTKTRKKELFQPLEPGKVRMYVCGITAYDYCHLGHARCYVAFDIIYRYLKYLGYEVTYIQNITDLDDKLIARAGELDGDGDMKERVSDLARKFTGAYFEDMKKLNVLPADNFPTATENIPEMQEIIAGLIEKGVAYEREGDVYYEVSAFPGYGSLSGKNPDDLRSGARVAIDKKKKNPLDFALWKAASPGEPAWDSPWGPGRPGWHIECSAMSMKFLGATFDIHGGGQDLIFPHHENEQAQSEAYTGKQFVRYWLHNGFVTINQEKMSKSLGNVFNLRDIYKVFAPRVVRFFLLSQHYRSPVDYSEEALKEARQALFRLDNCYGIMMDTAGDFSSILPDEEILAEFKKVMNDDFNTAAALAIVYSAAEEFYKKYRKPKMLEGLKPRLAAMKEICSILGVELINPIHDLVEPDPAIDLSDYSSLAGRIMEEDMLTGDNMNILGNCREAARKDKNWDLADRIRDYLKARDIAIMDRPGRKSALVYYSGEIGG
ncbi:MAG: cysteine--tRNA ligase [Candidatus Auribacterota bacterium]|nr:cysteine--tRNA ligase [Candidatus Auribacterota bacterium]